jgi:CRP-like cAMP-binding protein
VFAFLKRLFSPAPPRPAFNDDSGFVATQFVDRHADTQLMVDWGGRAADIGAQPIEAEQGVALLVRLLAHDLAMATLGEAALARLCGHLSYVQLPQGKQVIGQNEQGDHVMIVLDGKLVETRLQPSGEQRRLGEAYPGDLLGDLTGLVGETRIASWTSVAPVTLAVVSAHALDQMLADDPALAAALHTWMGKKVSIRLRQAHARMRAQTRPQRD